MPDFVHELRVRYGECDPQGIVFNANYLSYFDITVTELWRATELGSWQAMVERGARRRRRGGQPALPRARPLRRPDRGPRAVREVRHHERDARAGDPARRRAADRGLAAPGLRRRQDLPEDRDPRLGAGGAGRLRELRQRLRRGDEAHRACASRPRGRAPAPTPSLRASGPPSAISACQRATWRSISSWLTVRPRRRWPASALARSACRSTRCAGRPRRRASSAIVRRVSGSVPREWITTGRRPRMAARIRA